MPCVRTAQHNMDHVGPLANRHLLQSILKNAIVLCVYRLYDRTRLIWEGEVRMNTNISATRPTVLLSHIYYCFLQIEKDSQGVLSLQRGRAAIPPIKLQIAHRNSALFMSSK